MKDLINLTKLFNFINWNNIKNKFKKLYEPSNSIFPEPSSSISSTAASSWASVRSLAISFNKPFKVGRDI